MYMTLRAFKVSLLFAFILFIYGCATQPDELPTTYTSPLKYKKYDCDQLVEKMDHIAHRTADLYTILEKKAGNDAAYLGVGWILWPTLFLIDGDGHMATEYSNLKGEYEAIRQMTVEKKCSSEYIPPSPEEIIQERREEELRQQVLEAQEEF